MSGTAWGRGGAMRRICGLALVVGAVAVLAFAAGPDTAFAQFGAAGGKPTPFGMAGPAPETGIAGYILAKQAEFYRALMQAVRAAKADGNALVFLAGLSFAYGVFHAAGPGHGKAVISSYLLADGGTLKRGAALSLAAGVVQALSAILLVTVMFGVLKATAGNMDRVVDVVEIAAYGGIALFGLYLAFVKGRSLVAAVRGDGAHAHGADCGCGPAPDVALLEGPGAWRRAAAAVFSAGARPCSGAILILTFALSQGVFLSGVAAAFAMGLGTALTVTGIAALAVYGKRLAVRLAGTDDRRAAILLGGVELMAAVLVMLFGLALLSGYLESERLLPG